MADQYLSEHMLDMFIFETTQLLEQLEACILDAEKDGTFSIDEINEIFRIMHTLKGSAAMMRYDGISSLAHSMEDLFYFLREEGPREFLCSNLSDLVLAGVDFIKGQVENIKSGLAADGDTAKLIANNRAFLAKLKEKGTEMQDNSSDPKRTNSFKAIIYFQEGCEMENVRAFGVIHNLEDIASEIRHVPEDVMIPEAAEVIRQEGLTIYFRTECSYVDVHQLLMQTIFLKELELEQISDNNDIRTVEEDRPTAYSDHNTDRNNTKQQSIISVPVVKLDKLMDLMGEFVIAEAMVTQNTDLKGLILENFQKAARQLHKITNEIQDVIMSIRMVPLSATFQKMNRIVRDMCKKLEKEAQLRIIGDETEVDKNVIECISDPLIHLVRNALDHGIEHPGQRTAADKPRAGTITLEAKNSGNDVLIIVRDDGKGLDRDKILKKAKDLGLLNKPPEELVDREVYNLIFAPGFSTKEDVTEYSGRGVGMDVVVKNIESIGGSVTVDSTPGEGTAFILKIPLTLAIIDGMIVRVGSSFYTIPTISIRESFRPAEGSAFTDPDNNEMIMVRGQCYPIVRLYELFGKEMAVKNLYEGIIIITEQDEKTICIFVDEILGQQQVVVKAMPECIRNMLKTKWFAGCTLLGDGSISLILDILGLIGT